jgi:hypothetical protein
MFRTDNEHRRLLAAVPYLDDLERLAPLPEAA